MIPFTCQVFQVYFLLLAMSLTEADSITGIFKQVKQMATINESRNITVTLRCAAGCLQVSGCVGIKVNITANRCLMSSVTDLEWLLAENGMIYVPSYLVVGRYYRKTNDALAEITTAALTTTALETTTTTTMATTTRFG